MSYVTILWSMAAASALLLAVIHAIVWALDRHAHANLAFLIVALAVAGIAPIELGMMHSATPAEWGEWVRWCQVPIFVATVGTILFVRFHLGTGRWWLARTIIAFRSAILLISFTTDPNFNFQRIDSIDRVSFLGEEVSIVGDAVTSSWQWVASVCGVMFVLFILDASLTLFRQGGWDARRKASIVGGGVVAFAAISILNTQLMIWGLVRAPVIIALPFLITLGAMAFELSRDILRAPALARDLRESERRLELAASAAGLGLWDWDTVRNRMWVTERARALCGLSKNESIDPDRWLGMVHPEDAAGVRQAVGEAMANGQEYVAEYRVRLPNGHTRWIAARGRSEPDSNGRPALMRGVIRDITDQRQTQDESAELRRELAHAGRVTMLGQLASALAHELNQPLGAILRNAEAAEMILSTASPDLDELRAIIADIHRDDRRAGELIERLRALLKRRCMDMQAIALDDLVQDVCSVVRPDATARRVTLECMIAAGLPMVPGDRVHLSQVMINLIINGMDAISASEQRRRSVIVVARRGEGSVEVAVTDSGAGIPAELVRKVFEPFFTTKPAGMGMGLAVSRTIVEAHGGRIWAENNATGGATFRFTLPVLKESVQ